MSEEDVILDNIFAGVISAVPDECFFANFDFEVDIDIPGIFAILYRCIKNIILKILGYPIIWMMKLATLANDIVEAIEDVIAGSLDKINDLITKIMEVYNWFLDFLTDTKNWIISNCLEFYENFFIPLGPVEINLVPIDLTAIGLSLPAIEISIPLPANKAYRELEVNSFWKLFDPSAIIKMITKILDAILGFIMDYIITFMAIVIGIINAINDFLNSLDPTILYEWIAKLVQFFIDLAAPILKLVDKFVAYLVRMFNIIEEEIQEVIDKCLEWVSWILGLIPNLSFDFNSLPSWMKVIFKLVLCIINLTLSLMTGIIGSVI